jgi:hypothetical protein
VVDLLCNTGEVCGETLDDKPAFSVYLLVVSAAYQAYFKVPVVLLELYDPQG